MHAHKLKVAIGHNYLGTEHFLLACLQKDCNAGRILKNLGINEEDILKEMTNDPLGKSDLER